MYFMSNRDNMRAIDCCKQEWKTKWNELRELYLKTVRTIKLNGKEYTTDGSGGVVDLGTVETTIPTASEVPTDDDRNVQTAIDAIEDEIGSETASGSILAKIKANSDAIASETANRQNEDTQLANDIADESLARQNADNTLQTAIDEINGSISKNASDITSNKTEIEANASAITTKQDKLTAGTGISISDTNTISNTGVTSINEGLSISVKGNTGDSTLDLNLATQQNYDFNDITISANSYYDIDTSASPNASIFMGFSLFGIQGNDNTAENYYADSLKYSIYYTNASSKQFPVIRIYNNASVPLTMNGILNHYGLASATFGTYFMGVTATGADYNWIDVPDITNTPVKIPSIFYPYPDEATALTFSESETEYSYQPYSIIADRLITTINGRPIFSEVRIPGDNTISLKYVSEITSEDILRIVTGNLAMFTSGVDYALNGTTCGIHIYITDGSLALRPLITKANLITVSIDTNGNASVKSNLSENSIYEIHAKTSEPTIRFKIYVTTITKNS